MNTGWWFLLGISLIANVYTGVLLVIAANRDRNQLNRIERLNFFVKQRDALLKEIHDEYEDLKNDDVL